MQNYRMGDIRAGDLLQGNRSIVLSCLTHLPIDLTGGRAIGSSEVLGIIYIYMICS